MEVSMASSEAWKLSKSATLSLPPQIQTPTTSTKAPSQSWRLSKALSPAMVFAHMESSTSHSTYPTSLQAPLARMTSNSSPMTQPIGSECAWSSVSSSPRSASSCSTTSAASAASASRSSPTPSTTPSTTLRLYPTLHSQLLPSRHPGAPITRVLCKWESSEAKVAALFNTMTLVL